MSKKPVVFISYSHKDEPDRPSEGQERWLSYVRSHLDPLVESGLIEVWDDFGIEGGADWEPEILKKLAECDVCVLLVSRHSLTSKFILKVEIKAMLERRRREGAHVYPILVTPTSLEGADWLTKMNIRPRDKWALSGMSQHERDQTMVELVGEIAGIARRIAKEREELSNSSPVDIPETAIGTPSGSDGVVQTIDRYEPKPEIFGREAEIETIVGALLAGRPALVAGGPGMGKTAVATVAVYDPRVVAHFGERRVFVSLESSSEPRALLARMVNALGLTATGDDVSLLRLLETHVGEHPVAAILDNAETVFDADHSEAERILRLAAQVRGLSLAVTIRGVPPDVPDAVVIDDISKLDDDAARRAFLSVSGRSLAEDADLPLLLEALDGHALSIRLVAAQAKGLPSLAGLRESWEAEHAEILRKPGEKESRLTSVRASLALSVKSHRMQDTPLARRLLSLLAFLPGGLTEDSVRGLLGDRGAITTARANDAISCLYQLRLVEGGRPDRRLRMLTPLRESVRTDVPALRADRARLINTYLAIASKGENIGTVKWREVHAEVEAEADNLDPVCDLAIMDGVSRNSVRSALFGLYKLNNFSGRGDVQSLDHAVQQLNRQPSVALATYKHLRGDIALNRSDSESARIRFEEALILFKRFRHVGGESNCIAGLGRVASLHSDHETARAVP